MRLAPALLLLALACSSAPESEPPPTPILLSPTTRNVFLRGSSLRRADQHLDPETGVAFATYIGSRWPGNPHGPDVYINFYFAGHWGDGPVTLAEVDETLRAAYADSVLSTIPSPAEDQLGRYYVILLPSPKPRAHRLTLMRVAMDGSDAVNITLVVNLWGDAEDRLKLQRRWVQDSAAVWAAELGRVTLDPSWRGYLLALGTPREF